MRDARRTANNTSVSHSASILSRAGRSQNRQPPSLSTSLPGLNETDGEAMDRVHTWVQDQAYLRSVSSTNNPLSSTTSSDGSPSTISSASDITLTGTTAVDGQPSNLALALYSRRSQTVSSQPFTKLLLPQLPVQANPVPHPLPTQSRPKDNLFQAKSKYYVVTIGHRTGVYSSW